MAARRSRGWARGAAAFAAVALAVGAGRRYGWDGASAVAAFREARGALGPWAAPAYVAAHALTLALCPPYAIFFEGGAALIFGFLPGVACVFSAKVLGASLSFWIGRSRPRPPPCSSLLLVSGLCILLAATFWLRIRGEIWERSSFPRSRSGRKKKSAQLLVRGTD